MIAWGLTSLHQHGELKHVCPFWTKTLSILPCQLTLQRRWCNSLSQVYHKIDYCARRFCFQLNRIHMSSCSFQIEQGLRSIVTSNIVCLCSIWVLYCIMYAIYIEGIWPMVLCAGATERRTHWKIYIAESIWWQRWPIFATGWCFSLSCYGALVQHCWLTAPLRSVLLIRFSVFLHYSWEQLCRILLST